MIKVSIIGASGYTGLELIRLLCQHPHVELKELTARSLAGEKIGRHFPHLMAHLGDQAFTEVDLEKIKAVSDLVFICLPHGHSMQMTKELAHDVKVIDMGADFRLRDINLYEEVYQVKQEAPEWLEQAVYGLPEFYRDDIKSAQVIANPGCFVTNALLALMPLVENNLIDPTSIIIDSKTGVSGAGRSASTANLLSELGNSMRAYNPFGHRHIPEIEQELNVRAKSPVRVQFTPHLLPTERGIFSTIYAESTQELNGEELNQLYQEYYQSEAFVQVLESGLLPELKAVRGSNLCQMQVEVDPRTGRVLILSVLDNLMKGASGQAVQNMNLMFGLDEELGLTMPGLVP